MTAPNGLILMTESGYLMLAKSFTDDLAWTVQRELVNFYFRGKAPEPEQLILETSEYHYFPKTLNGEPVITVADFAYFTKMRSWTPYKALKEVCIQGEDWLVLSSEEMSRFKRENPSISRNLSYIYVIKASGVKKLLRFYGCSAEIPMIEEKKAALVTKKNSTDPNECVIALGVLGAIRESLKKAENTEAVEAFNIAIRQTAWEMSKRCIQ